MEHLYATLANANGRPSGLLTAGEAPLASQDDATLLNEARTRFHDAMSDETVWRQRANEDARFMAGEHWPQEIAASRGSERPMMVIDVAGTHIRSVTNEARQRNPGIKVSAVDSRADPETAQMIAGLVRNIVQHSHADIAYALAHEQAVGAVGKGYVRVVPQYVDELSFAQELVILPVPESLSVYFDNLSRLPDGSDANWAFISSIVPESLFRQKYGLSSVEMMGWDRRDVEWWPSGGVRVAEYWFKEFTTAEIVQLEDGRVMPKRLAPKEATVQQSRTTVLSTVWQAVITGFAVLSKTKWLGKHLPIAQEIGEVAIVDNKPDWRGMIRRIKDPQRLIDYLDSAKSEAIALAPKAPYILDPRQISGYEHYWQAANRENWPYLPYRAYLPDVPQALPPPQRQSVEPPIQAMIQGSMQAMEQIKAITGHHDPSMGASGPQQSGAAIQQEREAGNLSTYHFGDNQRWMIRRLGEILVDAIPHYYNEVGQVVRILGEDGVPEQVILNQAHPKPNDPGGPTQLFDVTTGTYDVTADVGPAFSTRRQEGAAHTAALMQAVPQTGPLLADLFVQMTDHPFANKMADRLKHMLPPPVLQNEPDAEKYQEAQAATAALEQLPQLQAQLAQMQQAVESLTQSNKLLEVQVANQEGRLALDAQKLQQDGANATTKNALELEAMRIDSYKSETDRLKVTGSLLPTDVQGGPYVPRPEAPSVEIVVADAAPVALLGPADVPPAVMVPEETGMDVLVPEEAPGNILVPEETPAPGVIVEEEV